MIIVKIILNTKMQEVDEENILLGVNMRKMLVFN